MAYGKNFFKCADTRKPECDGKKKTDPGKGNCMCLVSRDGVKGYPDGKCPFYKPDFSMTNGIQYPM